MGKSFSFTSTAIRFGCGESRNLPSILPTFGQHFLFVTGANPGRYKEILHDLQKAGIALTPFPVAEEPSTSLVSEGAHLAIDRKVDGVIAIGGGSSIDAGKAIAVLANNGGDPYAFLEVVGQGRKIEHPGLPCIVLPTTAGSGAEVTPNAVLSVPETGLKASLRGPLVLPSLAIIDPPLTLSLPRDQTISAGWDAITQLLEAFITPLANPLTDGFCREGLPRAAVALPQVANDGSNLSARTDMALSALLSGLALANAKLGAVHGFAAVIGGKYHSPHGAVCARLLPPVLRANLRQAEEFFVESLLERIRELGTLLTGRANSSAEDALIWVEDMSRLLPVPGLSSYGMAPDDFPDIIAQARQASSMKGNPVELTTQRMTQILEESL